jgi:hypothetical protein
VTNGPTEAINNLVKRVKRVEFGFRQRTKLKPSQAHLLHEMSSLKGTFT